VGSCGWRQWFGHCAAPLYLFIIYSDRRSEGVDSSKGLTRRERAGPITAPPSAWLNSFLSAAGMCTGILSLNVTLV